MNASNIAITPIDVRHNGKEKVTTTAKRVNKLVISFDVNNRIAQPGTTDVFVVVIGARRQTNFSQSLTQELLQHVKKVIKHLLLNYRLILKLLKRRTFNLHLHQAVIFNREIIPSKFIKMDF